MSHWYTPMLKEIGLWKARHNHQDLRKVLMRCTHASYATTGVLSPLGKASPRIARTYTLRLDESSASHSRAPNAVDSAPQITQSPAPPPGAVMPQSPMAGRIRQSYGRWLPSQLWIGRSNMSTFHQHTAMTKRIGPWKCRQQRQKVMTRLFASYATTGAHSALNATSQRIARRYMSGMESSRSPSRALNAVDVARRTT